jgi:hypothetical protein
MQGYDLLKKLISATGLPPEGPQQELEKLVAASGADISQISLDQLRVILANYLQDILLANSQDTSLEAAE